MYLILISIVFEEVNVPHDLWRFCANKNDVLWRPLVNFTFPPMCLLLKIEAYNFNFAGIAFLQYFSGSIDQNIPLKPVNF